MTDSGVRLERRGDVPLLVVQGALDYRAVDELTDASLDQLRTDGELAVDLSRLEFIDSTGLSLLLRLRHLAGAVRLVDPPPVATSLLRLTGVEALFVYEDAVAADV